MDKIGPEFIVRLDALALFLAGNKRFQGITLDGEPESWATAHNILEIEESCLKIISLVAAMELDKDGYSLEDFTWSLREELQHILYHVGDDHFLKSIL